MAEGYFHPGRRKRRIIMYERAMGAVFDLTPAERQIRLRPDLRELLETMLDVNAAYGGKANKDRCIVAGELVLSMGTNSVSKLIDELTLSGFIHFKPSAGGRILVVPETTLSAFFRLEGYAEMIDVVTRCEDRGMTIDATMQDKIDTLKEAGIYVDVSDETLDQLLYEQIEPIIAERVADRHMKRTERMKRTAGAKLLATILLVGSITTGPLQAEMADRGGTVGLILMSSYEK